MRIIARLAEDGRVEHGVELAGGEQILPARRFLPAGTGVDEWYVTSDVEVGERSIGQIRARRLADGRIELGYRDANGDEVTPAGPYLLAGPPAGVWLRSGAFEVPPAPPASEREESGEEASE